MTTIIKLPLSVQIKLGLEGTGTSNQYVPLAEYATLEAERDALRAALQRIADSGPPFSVKVEEWLSASEMAEVAVLALHRVEDATLAIKLAQGEQK